MAKKKRKYTKKTTNKRSSNVSSKSKQGSEFSIDVAVISMVIISFLLMVLIYSKSGALGEMLSPCLGGIMGWIKYIIPFGTFRNSDMYSKRR